MDQNDDKQPRLRRKLWRNSAEIVELLNTARSNSVRNVNAIMTATYACTSSTRTFRPVSVSRRHHHLGGSDSVAVIPVASRGALTLPPVLAGSLTPEIRSRVEHFYCSIYEIFERWVNRPKSVHTRRSYRDGVLSFVRHRRILWPQEAHILLTISVADVQTYRDVLAAVGAAPKTINHRVSALSSFYKYLALSAAELRLPILVPNRAHSQFIARESSDPREETLSLPAARARQLLNVSAGDSILAHRDRTIVKLYLYTGIRLATGCSLLVEDFRQEGEEATLRLREKGDKRRTIGLHYAAAQAIHEYLQPAELSSGPLFRPRRHSHTEELAATSMEPRTMWTILKEYLSKLPNALRERELPDGNKVMECVYTPHSLRATAATLLLDSGVDIMEVKELLGHRHVTTTQIYDKTPAGRFAQDAALSLWKLILQQPVTKFHSFRIARRHNAEAGEICFLFRLPLR